MPMSQEMATLKAEIQQAAEAAANLQLLTETLARRAKEVGQGFVADDLNTAVSQLASSQRWLKHAADNCVSYQGGEDG